MTKLPAITKKQETIILLLFRFRFLNRIQIQKLLNHQYASKINTWLKDLTEKKYISRSYETKFPDNLKPAVYHLDKYGITFLKNKNGDDAKALKKFYKENDRTDNFIECSLLLTDIYLEVQSRNDDKVQSITQVKSDYPSHPLKNLLCDLKPHAYIAQKKGGKTKRYFLEITADLPVLRLRQRTKKYLNFYQSNEWEAETGKAFPAILIVCPNNRVLAYIKHYLKTQFAKLDEPDLTIHLTTADKVKDRGITGDIWATLS